MSIDDILSMTCAKLLNGNDIKIDYFSINTGDINGNTMFFPLKGKTDGHDYILKGVNGGIAGFFVEKGHDDIVNEAILKNNDIVILEVKDVLESLQLLATKIREKLNIPVIALTGSFGKTSQREMIFSVLKEEFKVLSTKGNLNNHIGMPLTLVNYKDEDIILLELGSNHKGEIAFLRDICKPTITLVTNIGTAHIGYFKNLKNTLNEKKSIAKNSKYFLRNQDDLMLKDLNIKGCKIIDYGTSCSDISNVITDEKSQYTITVDNKEYKVTINSDINYLINYSICAFKIGLLLNMSIKNIIKGIYKFNGFSSRMEVIKRGKNIIINDCYNASYETMISGLNYFYDKDCNNKIVVLGDILELGSQSQKIHKELAKYIYKKNFNFAEIHLVGKEMEVVYTYLLKKGFNVFYYPEVSLIDKNILSNKSVYLKASNSIGLYKLIN